MVERLPYPPGYSIPLLDPWRHNGPAQYFRGLPHLRNGWYHDNRKLHDVKSSKAFIWPKDGRKGTKLGRFKDILQGKGPDIFVTCAADPKDFVAKRPSRAQWTRHTHLDGPHQPGFSASKFAPWTEGGMLSGGRSRKEAYDFRTRKYVKRYPGMWTDALWQSEPYKNRDYNTFPEAIRHMDGIWWQDAQHLPWELGGPVENDVGRNLYFQ